MIYWVTETAPTSVRIYNERGHYTGGRPLGKFKMGGALLPKEIHQTPRAWFERCYPGQVIHYSLMPRGGHFAAMELPDLLGEGRPCFFQDYQKPV